MAVGNSDGPVITCYRVFLVALLKVLTSLFVFVVTAELVCLTVIGAFALYCIISTADGCIMHSSRLNTAGLPGILSYPILSVCCNCSSQ